MAIIQGIKLFFKMFYLSLLLLLFFFTRFNSCISAQQQLGLTINHHADQSLNSFCQWQSGLVGKSGKRHDHAVLLTGLDICSWKNEPCDTLGKAAGQDQLPVLRFLPLKVSTTTFCCSTNTRLLGLATTSELLTRSC